MIKKIPLWIKCGFYFVMFYAIVNLLLWFLVSLGSISSSNQFILLFDFPGMIFGSFISFTSKVAGESHSSLPSFFAHSINVFLYLLLGVLVGLIIEQRNKNST